MRAIGSAARLARRLALAAGVVTASIERPALPRGGARARLAHDAEHREDIAPVDADAAQAIRDGLDGEPGARRLTATRACWSPSRCCDRTREPAPG